MTRKQTFHYSAVVFRSSPVAADTPAQVLGFVIGFKAGIHLVFATMMRKSVGSTFLNSLDQLSKDIIENRTKIIDAEIGEALNSYRTPAAVLKQVAARNAWALYVTPPRALSVEVRKSADSAPSEWNALFKDYAVALWHREVTEAKAKTHQIAPVKVTLPETPSDTPPAWMFDPTFLVRPTFNR